MVQFNFKLGGTLLWLSIGKEFLHNHKSPCPINIVPLKVTVSFKIHGLN